MPHRTLRKYDGDEAADPPFRPPPIADDRHCPEVAPAVDPMPPSCQLAKHPRTTACYAGGVTDGMRWQVLWWPVGDAGWGR
jgi:hypothetical protein